MAFCPSLADVRLLAEKSWCSKAELYSYKPGVHFAPLHKPEHHNCSLLAWDIWTQSSQSTTVLLPAHKQWCPHWSRGDLLMLDSGGCQRQRPPQQTEQRSKHKISLRQLPRCNRVLSWLLQFHYSDLQHKINNLRIFTYTIKRLILRPCSSLTIPFSDSLPTSPRPAVSTSVWISRAVSDSLTPIRSGKQHEQSYIQCWP